MKLQVIAIFTTLVVASAVVLPSSASAQHYVRPEFKKAECVKVDGGPNGIPSLTWDFALHVEQNDANRNNLTYRYRVYNLQSENDRLIYNVTDNTATERITFPENGRYAVWGYVIDSANDTVDPCRREITVTGPMQSPAPSESNTPTNSTPSTTTAPSQQNPDSGDVSEHLETTASSADETAVATASPNSSETTNTAAADTSNEKTASQPAELPNTGMNPIAVFGATSVVGCAVGLIRRRFF